MNDFIQSPTYFLSDSHFHIRAAYPVSEPSALREKLYKKTTNATRVAPLFIIHICKGNT